MKNLDFTDHSEVLLFARKENIQMIDLKVVDLAGRLHHLTLPVTSLTEDLFISGLGFDGSSYPGYKSVEAGDMSMIPDIKTAVIDPFCDLATLSFFCTIVEADSKRSFSRDPRGVCARAEQYLNTLGAGVYLISPEYEFYVFDNICFENANNRSLYAINISEGEETELPASIGRPGYHLPVFGGYHAIPPLDRYHDLRGEICTILDASGVKVKYHHHEVGGSGQNEIELGFEQLLLAADQNIWVKYCVRNVVAQQGSYATFLPKPLFGEPGSGMHVHQFLQKEGKSTFYSTDNKNYGNLSELGRHFVGGLLEHGAALSALCNPSTNSYRRLVPGFEAPVSLFYSLANRTSAIRIPKYARNQNEMRIEYRPPDATANPYLAFAAMLMAGLDGIIKRIEPPIPIDKDISHMPKEELAGINVLPDSLEKALMALESDHQFLLGGDVFSEDLIYGFIELKRRTELAEIAKRPIPMEFQLYFDL